MAGKTANTALAVAIQPVVDVFTTPTQPTDLMPFSNCSMPIEGVTLANDEYTGSPVRNADAVLGKRVSLSGTFKLRPMGGAVPAADAFLVGRLLRAAKMAEVRTATAIPAAPEALGGGSTTTVATLGATAAATTDLYKGMPLVLSSIGATYKAQLTAIRAYTAAKAATLAYTLAGVPTGNYQIPAHLAYMRSITSAAPILLSMQVWIDGHRYDLINCVLTSMNIVVPTSTRSQAAYPEINVTFDVTINANAAQATPAVTPLGAVPPFKDGKAYIAGTAQGLQTFTLDLGVQSEDPPNPNKVDGVDAAEFTGSVANISMTRQKYLPAVIDPLALADAQAQHAFFAQWGNTAGNVIQLFVPDARFNYQSPDLGGALVMESGQMMIDAFDRGVCINFA